MYTDLVEALSRLPTPTPRVTTRLAPCGRSLVYFVIIPVRGQDMFCAPCRWMSSAVRASSRCSGRCSLRPVSSLRPALQEAPGAPRSHHPSGDALLPSGVKQATETMRSTVVTFTAADSACIFQPVGSYAARVCVGVWVI